MEKLFTPFQTGDTDLVNRVVMAPMTRSRAMTSDTADELTAKYYQLRESVWGKPEVVRDGLRDLVRRTGADEIMVNSWQGTRLCQQRVKSDPLTVTTNGLILIHLVYSGLASAITPAFRFCFSR